MKLAAAAAVAACDWHLAGSVAAFCFAACRPSGSRRALNSKFSLGRGFVCLGGGANLVDSPWNAGPTCATVRAIPRAS